jgi:polysaccharide biosynthesis/export protein
MQPARLGAWRVCLVSTALLPALVALPGSAQTVETSQQTNDRIRSLSAAAHLAPPHDYVIGSGDLISVQVFDVPELSRELRVSQTGTIGFPLVPARLHISGLTEVQTEEKITEVLEANGLVTHPQVSVSVRERKSKPITVVGAVAHSMVYQADRPMTLVEILAEAGGIQGDAGDTVIITRQEGESQEAGAEPPQLTPQDAAALPANSGSNGAAAISEPAREPSAAAPPEVPDVAPPALTSTITVNLNQILERGDSSNNIFLKPGDVVTVPHAGIVYALGAVMRPGGFAVSNDRGQLTTLKLLSLAGGLDRAAKSDHAVIVRKDTSGQQHEVAVDLRRILKMQSEDVRLQPSDILYVPKSGGKQAVLRAAELAITVGSALIIYRLVQ